MRGHLCSRQINYFLPAWTPPHILFLEPTLLLYLPIFCVVEIGRSCHTPVGGCQHLLTATAVLVWLVGRGVMIRVITATLTAVPLPSTMQTMLMLLVMVQALKTKQTKPGF